MGSAGGLEALPCIIDIWMPYAVHLEDGTTGGDFIADPFNPVQDVGAVLSTGLSGSVVGPKTLRRWVLDNERASAKSVAAAVAKGQIPSAPSLIRCILDQSAGASSLVILGLLTRRAQLVALERELRAPIVLARARRAEAQILGDMARLSWPSPKVESWRRTKPTTAPCRRVAIRAVALLNALLSAPRQRSGVMIPALVIVAASTRSAVGDE